MVDEVLGIVVFVGYGLIVSLAVVLAVVVFRTAGGTAERAERSARVRDRSRSWWRRWR
ncbi:MAG TPA: hypothetical protein VGV93_10050 [Acidimicrobiales bacterium]|nr:hypothetical protein [Acidimicrobiales bacterium]